MSDRYLVLAQRLAAQRDQLLAEVERLRTDVQRLQAETERLRLLCEKGVGAHLAAQPPVKP
jgi:hypothetical protein